jgi:hypothetical protein
VLEAMRAQRDNNLSEAGEFRGYAANSQSRDPENRKRCVKIADDKEATAAKYEAAIAALESEATR